MFITNPLESFAIQLWEQKFFDGHGKLEREKKCQHTQDHCLMHVISVG